MSLLSSLLLQIAMAEEERLRSQMESREEDLLEREQKKQLDQLTHKQKGLIAVNAAEPKVTPSASPSLFLSSLPPPFQFFGRRRVNWN